MAEDFDVDVAFKPTLVDAQSAMLRIRAARGDGGGDDASLEHALEVAIDVHWHDAGRKSVWPVASLASRLDDWREVYRAWRARRAVHIGGRGRHARRREAGGVHGDAQAGRRALIHGAARVPPGHGDGVPRDRRPGRRAAGHAGGFGGAVLAGRRRAAGRVGGDG